MSNALLGLRTDSHLPHHLSTQRTVATGVALQGGQCWGLFEIQLRWDKAASSVHRLSVFWGLTTGWHWLGGP